MIKFKSRKAAHLQVHYSPASVTGATEQNKIINSHPYKDI